MPYRILSLQYWQRNVAPVFFSVAFLLALSQLVNASPGAHGPNGEHLDESGKIAFSENPKFESFTESFELLGEVFENKLVIYLHDFKSNVPVPRANIELESGELLASAEYSELLKAYIVTNQEMIKLLNNEGEHEIVLTVIADKNDDLMSANLNISSEHENIGNRMDEQHFHFSWWIFISLIIVFGFGYFLGRTHKGTRG
ncbi:hypothetical protein [Aliikangiella sp. G2MR2-5]|uniref:hypothetical protein n=1 Tax=Aliikangiella sp. G2MR2-5 TaxID=2788943 RepID=UPI0018A884A9|nr:hypothetical protein [Aliikangiella sp. G2MR2-5]